MKRILAICISFALSIGAISGAKAIEISGGMAEIWGAQVSTNGSTSVAIWQNMDYYISFNFDNKDSGWTVPMHFENAGTTAIAEVLDNGKVFIAYSDIDGKLNFVTTKDGNNFSEPVMIPKTSGMEFGWNFDIESAENIVTIVSIPTQDSSRAAYSWSSNVKLNSWDRKLITNNVMPSTVFDDCGEESDTCRHSTNITLGISEGGQQIVFVDANLTTESGAWIDTWGYFAVQRKSAASSWKNFQALDRFGPAETSGYSMVEPQFSFTKKGKAAVSFKKGIFVGETTHQAIKIFVSAGFDKQFVQKDSGTLSAGFGSSSAKIFPIGEDFYMVYNQYLSDPINEFPNLAVKYAEVGHANKGTKIIKNGRHTVIEAKTINGIPTVVTFSTVDSKNFGSVTKLKKGEWTTPKKIWSGFQDRSLFEWSTACDSSANQLVCTAATLQTTVWEYEDLLGVDAKFIN